MAALRKRDGPPIVVGANQAVHLKPNMGIRTNGVIGGPGNVTLEYFDFVNGRADSIRFLLFKAGVKHKFVGHSPEKWTELKSNPPQGGEFNGLPRLTIDGVEYGQSMAVLRALGTKHGLYFPEDPKTSYYCDVIIDCFVDVLDETTNITLPVLLEYDGKPDPDDIQGIVDIWKKVHVPLFKMLCTNMRTHGGKYAAGNVLTIADCIMVSGMANIWCNQDGPWNSTFNELFARGNVDKGVIDVYFATLREAFSDRLNNPNRKALPI